MAERSKKRLEAALERQRRQEREQEDGQGEEARAAAALRQQLQRKSVDLDEVAKERDATKARLAELEKASSASLHKMSEEFQKQVRVQFETLVHPCDCRGLSQSHTKRVLSYNLMLGGPIG